MSRLLIRVVLTVLVFAGILAAVFFGVRAVSASVQNDSLGMYVLSGNLVNPFQPQSAPDAQEQAPPQLQPFPSDKGEGHGGCESENYIDPNDL